jgi:hypothetical protein
MNGGHPLVTLNVNVDVHVYSHGSPVEQQKLDQVLDAVKTLIEEEKVLRADLTMLTAQVKQNVSFRQACVVAGNRLQEPRGRLPGLPQHLPAVEIAW